MDICRNGIKREKDTIYYEDYYQMVHLNMESKDLEIYY